MTGQKIYEGIDKDPKGAMKPTGNIIRDAWVFQLIPETETCAGWTVHLLSELYTQVNREWELTVTWSVNCRLTCASAMHASTVRPWNRRPPWAGISIWNLRKTETTTIHQVA